MTFWIWIGNRNLSIFNSASVFLSPKQYFENVELLLVWAEYLAKKGFKFYLLSDVTVFTSSCAISTAIGVCTLPVIHSFLLTDCLHFFLRDFHSKWCQHTSCNPQLPSYCQLSPTAVDFAEKNNWIRFQEKWPSRGPQFHQFTIQNLGIFECCRGAYNYVSSHHFMNMPLSIHLFSQEIN